MGAIIAYYSKTLNRAKRNYCVPNRNYLHSLGHWNISISTSADESSTCAPAKHSALTWLMSFKNLKEQTASWIQRLEEYSFTSEQLQG
jgi:hypothetical protein